MREMKKKRYEEIIGRVSAKKKSCFGVLGEHNFWKWIKVKITHQKIHESLAGAQLIKERCIVVWVRVIYS